jgi:DNA-binding transcriptional ArsR family regulator
MKPVRSEGPDFPDERTILTGSDQDFIADLTEYLDVLASPVRLQILSYIGVRGRTARQISYEIRTSSENTKKHLTRLQSLGLIRKEIVVSEEPGTQGQPVFYYYLIPGGLEHAVKSLVLFSSIAGSSVSAFSEQLNSVRKGLMSILPSSWPRLLITNGPEYGRLCDLTGDMYRIGRNEDEWDGILPEPAILLSDEYRSVSRISRPHAWLRAQDGRWIITEGISRGGTTVNGHLVLHEPVILKDGDRIELSPGLLGVVIQFLAERS